MSTGAAVARTAEAATRRSRHLGMLFAAGAAMLFAIKGLIAKVLYARGVGFEAVVVIRAVLSLPMFWVFAASRGGLHRPTGAAVRATVAAALGGFLCYYVGTVADFYALTLIDASLERVLLFSYPALVVAFTALLTRTVPSRATLGAVALTYLGIFLVVGGLDPQALRTNALGAGCVLFAALCYAVYFMIGERYVPQIGSTRFALVAMTAATAAFVVHGFIRHGALGLGAIGGESWLLLALLAVACMFLPALMQAEGVRRIGAERSAIVSTVGPPTTALLAWFLLGETLGPGQILGTALIVGGVLLLDLSRARRGGA